MNEFDKLIIVRKQILETDKLNKYEKLSLWQIAMMQTEHKQKREARGIKPTSLPYKNLENWCTKYDWCLEVE